MQKTTGQKSKDNMKRSIQTPLARWSKINCYEQNDTQAEMAKELIINFYNELRSNAYNFISLWKSS